MTDKEKPVEMLPDTDATGRFVADVVYAAAYGAVLEAMGEDYGFDRLEVAEDTANRIAKAALASPPLVDDDNVDVNHLIILAASTGVKAGRELAFRKAQDGEWFAIPVERIYGPQGPEGR